MPDPMTHTATGLASASAVLAFVFDVPAPVVFAAFSGACFAVALAETMPYWRAAGMIFGGTVASSYVAPLALHYFGDCSQRGVAAVLAFVLLHFRQDALDLIKRGLSRVFGARNDDRGAQ